MQSMAQVEDQLAEEDGHGSRHFAAYGAEPALEALLDDPVTHAVMACDRVSTEDLRSLLDGARAALMTRMVGVAA